MALFGLRGNNELTLPFHARPHESLYRALPLKRCRSFPTVMSLYFN